MNLYRAKRFFITISIIPLLFISLGLSSQPGSQTVIHKGNLYYLAHTVVIKLKNQSSGGLSKAQNLTAQLNVKLSRFKFSSSKEMFGTTSLEVTKGLNRIVMIKYDAQDDPYYVASKIKETNSNIEWVEPKYVRRLTSIPNDPSLSSQYNLALIQAEKAWNISQGDTNVVIGIVDSGVDWPHPDLYANIWHNWKDIKSNWSGDTDGIIGDSIGWDFGGLGDGSGNATPDNNPIEDKPAHGTLVAGTACAVTNNGIGVAGIGYKCKIMPVKVSEADEIDPTTNDPYILYGFEGIKYAADNGAKVINCSWGGGGYSSAEQDIINYAIAKGALVVAAAGNDGVSDKFYPAAYDGVLSAAATDQNDKVASYSNYGSSVDVAAPGNSIYSTWQPNTYISGSGTSFASPLTSGVAALVFSHFPNYTPLQVAEQIRVNCDNIDALNPSYAYQVGKGRINAYKALADTNSESVRAVDVQFSDAAPGGNGNGAFEPGETITLGIKFVNYLRPVQNLNVTLVSMNSSYLTVNNSSFSKSNVAALDSMNNYDSKFSFTLSSSLPYDATLQLRLDYTDGDYSDFQLINIPVNPTYFTQSGNNISLTVTSKGNLSFNDYPNNTEGNGFRYKNGNNLLFEGALMFGTSSSTIEDVARDAADGSAEDNSFSIVQPLEIFKPGDLSYQHGTTIFNDNNSSNKLGIVTRLDSYSYSSTPDVNYIILKYSFVNNSQAAISNLYTGIYFDWDMVDGQGDSTAWDTQGNLGYVTHTTSTFDTLVATALISSADYGYWGIRNDGSDGFGVYTGFSNANKWKALSSGIGKAKAGVGDISEVTSGGPYKISAGDTIRVAFAVATGNSLSDLRSAITNARAKYQEILTDVSSTKNSVPVSYNLSQNYPNPFNPSTVIKYQVAKAGNVSLKIFDILGREVATLINEEKSAGNYSINFNAASFPSGVYFYQIRSGSYIATKKMVLLK